MDNDSYKAKVARLIAKAREKCLIKTYSQFCEEERKKGLFQEMHCKQDLVNIQCLFEKI